jgi:hypothetical protein
MEFVSKYELRKSDFAFFLIKNTTNIPRLAYQ